MLMKLIARNYRFDEIHFVADCVYLFSSCSVWWAAIVDRSRENAENTRYVGSRSLKVIEFTQIKRAYVTSC